MKAIYNPQDDREAWFGGDLRQRGFKNLKAVPPPVRYRQGRWFARLLLKLVRAMVVIVVLAVLVGLTIALFAGVQG